MYCWCAVSGKGGYQAPAHPASVSGIGKNSRRTDGGPQVQKIVHMPDAGYGEQQQFLNEQRSAPLAAGPQVPAPTTPGSGQGAPGGGAAPQDLTQLGTPIHAPTQRPNEPVTHGAALGAGGGTSVLNLPPPEITAQQTAAQYIQQLAATSNNPAVAYLAQNIRGSF